MAWTTIELIGEEPLQVAHPVEYVGPDGYALSNMVQFFTAGGNISAWSAAHIVLGAKYADRRMFIIDHDKDGGGVYARLWEHGSGANLHGGRPSTRLLSLQASIHSHEPLFPVTHWIPFFPLSILLALLSMLVSRSHHMFTCSPDIASYPNL